ncbi:hypothetical protein GGI12_001024 [Dipsacomyces acuminosporus]|nr:hypothetical protein GGI12_001024 [Dipsacomyces acuminosporus]
MSELKLSNILRLPQNQKSDKSNVPTEAPLPTIAEEGSVSNTPTSTSYLFLTPSLLCLRLEEPACSSNSSKGSRTALLGHSLLSLINRSLLDFVSECDRPQVQAMLDAMKHKLSTRLVRTTSRVYSHAILGQPPRAVDPNTFQAFSVDRLLQRVCADISGNVRAHLRTASGGYDLFDMHIYVGAVSSSAGPFDRHAESPSVATSGLAQDEVYFVCRITKFDALNCASVLSSPVLPRIFMPSSSPESCERPAKRPCIATNSSDALYMLASVTENDASTGKCSTKQSVYSSQSTVTSSPLLATPSPSLSSSPRIATTLPSISDLLKSIDETEKSRFSRPSPPHSQFMSPFSNKF